MVNNEKTATLPERMTYKCPALLVERYVARLHAYGFRNKTEALKYLAIGLWNRENGVRNSYPVQGIIDRVEAARHPFLLSLPKESSGIRMSEDERARISSICGYGSFNNLMNAIMEAFTFADTSHVYWLRMEMHRNLVNEIPATGLLSAMVSHEQHALLSGMASRAGTTIAGLARITIDTILGMEGRIQYGTDLPHDIEEALAGYMRRAGFTLHLFSARKEIVFCIDDDSRFRDILGLIRQYKIPGVNEFLRRVLLFLLESGNLGLHYEAPGSEDDEFAYLDENEAYVNERLSRRDFARSIYQ